ncbi:Sulfurtransferase [bioreactor metagenome]|uniref:Sulfurtransferase n=1 Tax=bioreactor metagenome TaxID=1076179 RepID=A0A645IAX6_9ZZZZ
MNIKEISANQANELLTESAMLLDVREEDEIQQEAFVHDEVLNIPFSIFDENYDELPKDRKIVVACHLGIRSLRVAQFLVIQGWDEANIFSLEGGIEAWQQAGLPVKTAPRTFSFAKPASSCGCGSDGCC